MISVWVAEANSYGGISSGALGILDQAELAKSREFRSESSRRRYLIGRILLRQSLSRVVGGDPRAWRFLASDSGKIRLAHQADLPFIDFSLSYSRTAVAVAVSSTGQIGVDIECVEQASCAALPEGAFTKSELEFFESLPAESKWREVLRLWTIKEAYAKLLGVGLQLDFSTFEALPPQQWIHLETRELKLDSQRYHLAVATRPFAGRASTLSVYVVPQKDFETETTMREPPSVSLMSS